MTSVEERGLSFDEFLKELCDNKVCDESFYIKGGDAKSSGDDDSESDRCDEDSAVADADKRYRDLKDLGVVIVDAEVDTDTDTDTDADTDTDTDTDTYTDADTDADADMINGSEQCSEEVDHRNSETQLNVDCSNKRMIIIQEDPQCKRQRKAMMKQGTIDDQVQDLVSLVEGKDSRPPPEEELGMGTNEKLVEDQSSLLEKKYYRPPPDEEELGKDQKELRQLQESQRTDECKDQQKPDNVLYKPVREEPRRGWIRVVTSGSVKALKGKELGSIVLEEGGYGVTICDNDGKLIAAAAGVSKPVSVVYHRLEAVKKGMELAIRLGFDKGIVYSDSTRVIYGLVTNRIRCENVPASMKYVHSLVPELYAEGGNTKPTEENTRDLCQLLSDIKVLRLQSQFRLRLAPRRMIAAAKLLSKCFRAIEMDSKSEATNEVVLWKELEKLFDRRIKGSRYPPRRRIYI